MIRYITTLIWELIKDIFTDLKIWLYVMLIIGVSIIINWVWF